MRWRKKVLKLAELTGWEVANEIGRQTASTLEINVEDILMANLNFLYMNQQLTDNTFFDK